MKKKIGYFEWIATDPQSTQIVLKWGSFITACWFLLACIGLAWNKYYGSSAFLGLMTILIFKRFWQVRQLEKQGVKLEMTISEIASMFTNGRIGHGRIKQQSNDNASGQTEQVDKTSK
jgi:hypothetical protein